MIPEINFRYSEPYDNRFRENPLIISSLKKLGKTYPTTDKVRDYVKEIKQYWKTYNSKLLREIEKVTGLKWNEKVVKCYIVGRCRPFSDPLTIGMHKNNEDFRDTLIHELIHQIQIQNRDKTRNWWNYLDKRYSKEKKLTKNHIFLHAILEKIYLDNFDESRLEHDKEKCSKDPDYSKAWKIVEKEGADNVIKKFREVCKIK